MSATVTNPPNSYYGPVPEGFPPLARLTVDQYELMIAAGAFDDNDQFELIEGALVSKMTKKPSHSTGSELCGEALRRLLPAGWHVRIEKPVRIPTRDSMPEPDISVVRGGIRDYEDRDPTPEDVALIVEVSYTTVRADRALAATYMAGGIPVYWLVNILDRKVEIHTPNALEPTVLAQTDSAELIIAGQIVGNVPVGDLLPTAGDKNATD
jgi:Uma2 family endonuclease